MIMRPFTIFSVLLFVLSGAFMFVVKHRSALLDDELSATNQATTQDEQSIRVLQAQWALEADPSRLAALATQFTGLQPMKPGQLVALSSLGGALPPPGAPPPGNNPEDPVPALPQLAAAAPASSAAAAPVQVAAATPPAATVAVPVPAPTHLAAMTAPAAPRHHFAAIRLASTARHVSPHREMGSALYLADANAAGPMPHDAPMGAQVMAVRAVATPPPMPAATAMDGGGSLLGMAQGGSQ